MTREEFEIICTPHVQSAIAENRHRDPLAVAADRRLPHARLIATQVKYLARAAAKLPSYAAAQCILPPLSFEQASSEACAAHKRIEGRAALDLTCGLGVDSLFLSQRFERVVALERDAVLARIATENFARLGVSNVEVINTSAEEYLQRPARAFDWVYADPDRRSAQGRKLVRLEECSPNILGLMPLIAKTGGRLCLKNSPLFDVDEAFRLFGGCSVEVVSLGGECKEVVVYADHDAPTRITATALGVGSFAAAPDAQAPSPGPFRADEYRYLVIPDVALQKARLVRLHLAGKADVWSENGYGFAVEKPEGVVATVLDVERIEAFDPKALKRQFKGQGVELLKRDFPLDTVELMRRIGAHAGDSQRLAFTKIGNDYWVIRLK